MNVFKQIMQRSGAALLALAAALFLLMHAPQARAKVFYGITTGGSIFSVATSGSTATDVFNFAIPAAAGYTLATRPLGYCDDDLTSGETSSKGVFIRLRFKFDGDLFGGKSAKSSSVNEKTAGASTVAAETGKN